MATSEQPFDRDLLMSFIALCEDDSRRIISIVERIRDWGRRPPWSRHVASFGEQPSSRMKSPSGGYISDTKVGKTSSWRSSAAARLSWPVRIELADESTITCAWCLERRTICAAEELRPRDSRISGNHLLNAYGASDGAPIPWGRLSAE